MKKIVIITILILFSFLIKDTVTASNIIITNYEIEPFIVDLRNEFNQVNKEILQQNSDDPITSKSINEIEKILLSIPSQCSQITSNSSINNIDKSLDKYFEVLSQVESLKVIVESIRIEYRNYLQGCLDNYLYNKSIIKISEDLERYDQEYFEKFRNQELICDESVAKEIENDLVTYKKDYSEFFQIISSRLNEYNSNLLQYQNLMNSNAILKREIDYLSGVSARGMEGLNFASLKISTTQEEINKAKSDVLINYGKISGDVLDESDLEGNLESNSISFSFNKGNNWLIINESSIYSGLQFLNDNKLNVKSIIQSTSEAEKKASENYEFLSKKVAFSILLNNQQLLSSYIYRELEDNQKIIENAQKSNSINKEIVYSMIDQNKEFLNRKNTLDRIQQRCITTALERYKSLKQKEDSLNADFKKEYEKRIEQELNRNQKSIMSSIIQGNLTDSYDAFVTIDIYEDKLNELNTCSLNESLEILSESKEISREKSSGVEKVVLSSDDPNFINADISSQIDQIQRREINNNLTLRQLMEIVQKEVINNSNFPNLDNLRFNYNAWEQDFVQYEEKYSIYSCSQGSWQKSQETSKIAGVLEECKRINNSSSNYNGSLNETLSQVISKSLLEDIPEYDKYSVCINE